MKATFHGYKNYGDDGGGGYNSRSYSPSWSRQTGAPRIPNIILYKAYPQKVKCKSAELSENVHPKASPLHDFSIRKNRTVKMGF